ncbi:MAG: response regulator with CheY-like receiver domain and winged-helix DNA-binding domain [Pedosphaera sp.]|nr:response regulator with CheY-like receiver domain and winged-helix DNA-binding domain [Pedosphaera sp.]
MAKTILQVEDDEDDVFLLRHAMDKVEPGCLLSVASDGQMAIDYFKGSGKFHDREAFPLPALVLLDLKLPQLPGLEVLKWMRSEAGLDVPVIILSSSKNKHDISAAYKLGANAYLVKPSDPGQLLEMAKLVRGFWLVQNTLPPAH